MQTLTFRNFTVTTSNPVEFLVQTGLEKEVREPKTAWDYGWEEGYSHWHLDNQGDDNIPHPQSDSPEYLSGYEAGWVAAGLDW